MDEGNQVKFEGTTSITSRKNYGSKIDEETHDCMTDDVTDVSRFRIVADQMDNLFSRMFQAHPDRVIFMRNGKVVYIGKNIIQHVKNPTRLMTHEARDWLEENFLALTDLLTGVFCTSLTIVVSILRHLQLNEVCAIRRCFCSSFVNISSLFVAFACLDRFLAITRPLHYHTIMTVRRARITILAIAIFGTLVGAFSVFPSSRTTLCISNFTSNSSLRFRPSVLVSITTFFGSLAIAMYTNTRVVAVAVHQTYRVTDEAVANGSAAGDAPVQRPKLRGLTAIVIATSAYCVAVIPWAIVSAAQMDPSTTISSPDVRFFTSLLLLSNSYWNPLIFALLSNKFRAAVKKTLGIKSEDNQNGNVTMSSIAAS
ncbi:probable G-protein coupled receptor 21 [Lytechinus pictus]|uniref:probable G-protein coupled receptor 21 n=1 Tax=Lytechinus pictus TaxID=7653 RepID=UPI0030BA14CB